MNSGKRKITDFVKAQQWLLSQQMFNFEVYLVRELRAGFFLGGGGFNMFMNINSILIFLAKNGRDEEMSAQSTGDYTLQVFLLLISSDINVYTTSFI